MRKILVLFILLATSCSSNLQNISRDWSLFPNKFILSESQHVSSQGSESIDFNRYSSIFSPRLSSFGSIKKILVLEEDKAHSLYVSEIYSASRIWINGKLYQELGSLGKTVKTSSIDFKRSVIHFTPNTKPTEIVIEYSNFHFSNHNVLRWIYLGNTTDINKKYIQEIALDYLVIGSLVVCFVLFALLSLVKLDNKYNLYMALFTLSSVLYLLTFRNTFLGEWIPWLNLSFIYQFNNLSSIWIYGSILLFFNYLYPIEFNKKKTRFVLYSVIFASLLFIFPVYIFNALRIILIIKLQIFVTGIIIITSLITSFRNRRPLSLVLLLFFTTFWTGMIFDFLFDTNSSVSVLFLVISMFVLVAIKRAETSKSIEDKQDINNKIRSVFTQFVPLKILDSLGNSELTDRPPGEYSSQEYTMMLLDIRDFTKMSDSLSSEDNFVMINKFYDIVGTEVDNHRGFIESYGGDGVKAIFPETPDDAIKCANAISKKVAETSGIKIGLAIHYGEVILGTIGSDERIQASAVSEVTRTLNAMDHFESKMGVEILLTDSVFNKLTIPKSNILYLGNITLKGEINPVDLYQVIPSNFSLDPNFRKAFEEGIGFVKRGKYNIALSCFEKAHSLRQSHVLTSFYIKQLTAFNLLESKEFHLVL